MAKQKITIVRGTTNSFAIAITDEEGEAYELESGEVLRFGVKKTPNDAQYILTKEFSTADENDEYPFSIVPDDTINLPFGTYYYDIGLQSGSNYFNIIPASDFVVAYNVTEWEE